MNERIVPGTLAVSSVTRSRAVFTGENGEFRSLVTRGALLEIVTFGFYRFWLATNMRRHLWSNSSVAGDALEYTGTGRELLIGFLFALTILVPIYLVYFVIGIEAERWQAFAGVPFGLLYYGFWQFAVYRARRYRLTRTLWRGVRFWMTGSGTAYALRAFGWTLLTVVTLGLAYPWRAAALERYKMGHTFYGDLPGRFEGEGWDFFKRGWWLWLLVLGLIAGLGGILAVSISMAPAMTHALSWPQLQFSTHGQGFGTFSDPNSRAQAGYSPPQRFSPPQRPLVLPPQAGPPQRPLVLPPQARPPKAQQGSTKPRPNPKEHVVPIPEPLRPFWVLLIITSLLAIPFIYPAFKATEWKWWAQGLRFGDLRFDSDLARKALIGNFWKTIGVSLLVLIAVSVAIGVVGGVGYWALGALGMDIPRSGKKMAGAHLQPVLVAFSGVSYLASMLAVGVVLRIYLGQRIWKLVVASISIENLAAAEHVVARGEAASALGEGLADSLDVAGF